MIGIQSNKVTWDEENLQKLMAGWEDGKSAALIALEIPNATRNSILGKAHRLGLKNRKNPASVTELRPQRVKMVRIVAKKEIKPQPAPNGSPLIPFLESGATTCRSIHGYDNQGLALFCPNPKIETESFCPYHLSIYYVSGSGRDRR